MNDNYYLNLSKIFILSSLLGFCALLISFYFVNDLTNIFIPFFIISLCFIILIYMLFLNVKFIPILPTAWFFLAMLFYYGIGQLFFVLADTRATSYVEIYYKMNTEKLFDTNILNLFSLSLILFFLSIFFLIPVNFFKKNNNTQNLKNISFIFSILGVSFTSYHEYLRFTYGADFIMPGIYYVLGGMTHVSICIYTYLIFKGEKNIFIYYIFILLFTGYFALTSFMKQEIIEFLLAIFFGFFIARPNLKNLIIGGLFFLIMLPILNKLASIGRIFTWSTEKEISYLDSQIENMKKLELELSELKKNKSRSSSSSSSSSSTISSSIIDEYNESLIKIKKNVLRLETIYEAEKKISNLEKLWLRLSYSAQQSFAITSYNSGKSGNTFKDSYWALIPRLLYPDKPIINHGGEFNFLVKGTEDGGGMGPGFFAEGYWNYGWYGVIFVSFIVSICLFILTKFTIQMIKTENVQYFSILTIGLDYGYRIDDWFIAVTINSIPIMIFLIIITYIISNYRFILSKFLN